MRIIFGSDIHGSAVAGEWLVQAFLRERADLLVLCGDIYYHGPRNPLPGGYEPMRLADILNDLYQTPVQAARLDAKKVENQNKLRLRCVRGNCDSEVDAMISKFAFEEHIVLEQDGRTIFVTHGHVYDKNRPPQVPFDIMIYGHFHVGFIERMDGKIFASPGSVSLPKEGSAAAYLVLDEQSLTLKTLDGEQLLSTKL